MTHLSATTVLDMVTGRLAKREADLRRSCGHAECRDHDGPEDLTSLLTHIDGITTARVLVEGLRKELVLRGDIPDSV